MRDDRNRSCHVDLFVRIHEVQHVEPLAQLLFETLAQIRPFEVGHVRPLPARRVVRLFERIRLAIEPAVEHVEPVADVIHVRGD